MRKLLALLFALIALTLPASALDLPDGLDGAVPGELLESAEKGDDLMVRGAAFLWETLRTALGETLASSLRAAVALMLLALLCGLADGTAEGTGETAVRFVPYVGVLGAAGLAAGDMHSLIGLGLETLDELAAMAKLLLPTMAAAMAGGGMVGTASVWQVGALMLSDLFLSLIRDLLVPVLCCVIAAAAAGALLPESGLTPLAEGAKKLLGWALGAVLTAFVAFLSLSGILAGSADRVAVRVGKTVVSGAVPVVGGILSEATEAMLAAAGALRSTLGVLGVFAVLALCLAPLVQLGVQYLLYRAAAFFCGVVGPKTLSDFLQQLSSAFSLMFAMTAGGAFLLLASLLVALMMVVGV